MIKLTSIFASMRPGQDGTDRAAKASVARRSSPACPLHLDEASSLSTAAVAERTISPHSAATAAGDEQPLNIDQH